MKNKHLAFSKTETKTENIKKKDKGWVCMTCGKQLLTATDCLNHKHNFIELRLFIEQLIQHLTEEEYQQLLLDLELKEV